MLRFHINPAAVVKMLLYSDPDGFQRLKQNATNDVLCIFKTIKGSIPTITASNQKLTSKKKTKTEAAEHAKKQVIIPRINSVTAIISPYRN